MTWLAIVPLKRRDERKGRLAAVLTPDERRRLAEAMLTHVRGVLQCLPEVEAVLLSPDPHPDWPKWLPDEGPLNARLDALRQSVLGRGMIVLNADLPFLTAADVRELADAARSAGRAIAPDRHGGGTNAAAAAAGVPLRFRFGAESAAGFAEANSKPLAFVTRRGLADDVDLPADLDRLRRQPMWRPLCGSIDSGEAARHF